ncbi:MAG: MarR family transcriptional regulator [Agathobacter sp.]|nr:MarR family transcriptional regulator [Agathobacter sp.]
MNYQEYNFEGIDNPHFLIGLLNATMNCFQTVGDTFFEEMSWKQCFVIICIGLFDKPPTLKELSELMSSSHQNVKRMVNALEKNGYVEIRLDENDKRKRRIALTPKALEFNERYDKPSGEFMEYLFEGLTKEELDTTVKVLLQIDSKLKEHKMKNSKK